MTRTYTLQADRHKFSRYEIAPTCQMCNQEPEDLTHMLTTCSALSETRKETFNPIKNHVTKFIGERKWKETFFDRHQITVLIIDCTNFSYIFRERVDFHSSGKCIQAVSSLSDKAKTAYFALKSKLPYSENLSVKTYLQLFNSMITPILTYGSEVWLSEFKPNFEAFIDKKVVDRASGKDTLLLEETVKRGVGADRLEVAILGPTTVVTGPQ
ncbi:unnamed protein product [Mytilus edulis]|uniref:Uncharacterized protein n=1 Tax=Mytilus edulis TaxID=6550 RepID=A0A8S3QT39_MYTED|nr:unnamed protein product [Mytilus edulis]